MVKAIKEVTAFIKRGQKTSLEGAHLLDDALEGYIGQATANMVDGAARPTNDPLAP